MGLTAALSACIVSRDGLCALRMRRPAAATEGRAASAGLAMVREAARLLDSMVDPRSAVLRQRLDWVTHRGLAHTLRLVQEVRG